MKRITAKQAEKIIARLGLNAGGSDDGITFYATDERESEIYSFDSKKECDDFVKRHSTE